MNEFMLSLFHYEKEAGSPTFSIRFPEPSPKDTVGVSRSGDSENGWEKRTLAAIGIGRLFCYRQIRAFEPVTFIMEPSEPVVCLRLHLEGRSTLGYLGEENQLGQNIKNIHFFWQGEQKVEQELTEGLHTLVELYLRPQSLSHLSDRKVIKDIIDQSLTQKCGPIDQYVFNASVELFNYMMEMTGEIDEKEVSVERFHHLFDSLIQMCLGEKVDVEPRLGMQDDEQIVQEKASEEECHYVPNPEVKSIFDELEGESRETLSVQFYELLDEIEKLKQFVQEEKELKSKMQEAIGEVYNIGHERLGKEHMEAAYLLADWHKTVSGKNKRTLKKAILRLCETSFKIRMPSIKDVEFYTNWSDFPYELFPMNEELMTEFMSFLGPPRAPELTPPDGTTRGNKLFFEQVTEAFGFKNIADLNPEMAKGKSKEVKELYEKLLFQFSNTLTFGKSGGILRSDIIRELDIAYRENDFITLLQIEGENFGKDSDFLKDQSDEKLKWLVTSLHIEKDHHQEILQEIKQDPDYNNLETFRFFGCDKDKFTEFLKDDLEKYDLVDNQFSLLIADLTSFPSEEKVIALAKSVLRVDLEL